MGDIQRAKVGTLEKAGYLLFFGWLFPTLIISDVIEALGFEF
jgi:hypothetical protein